MHNDTYTYPCPCYKEVLKPNIGDIVDFLDCSVFPDTFREVQIINGDAESNLWTWKRLKTGEIESGKGNFYKLVYEYW